MLKSFISASILSSDLSCLAEDSNRMIQAGCDWIHLDVMDGHFVPNLTFGAPVLQCLRKHTKGFFDCHLMVENPEKYVAPMAKAGVEQFIFHIEATDKVQELIDQVKAAHMKVGIAVKPHTSIETVMPYVDQLDIVLMMGVEPGFSGQKFNPLCLEKIRTLRQKCPTLNIGIDGGVNNTTIVDVTTAGANVVISGSALFNSENPKEFVQQLRDEIDKRL